MTHTVRSNQIKQNRKFTRHTKVYMIYAPKQTQSICKRTRPVSTQQLHLTMSQSMVAFKSTLQNVLKYTTKVWNTAALCAQSFYASSSLTVDLCYNAPWIYDCLFQRYLMTIHTYFTRWLIHTTSCDLTHTIFWAQWNWFYFFPNSVFSV